MQNSSLSITLPQRELVYETCASANTGVAAHLSFLPSEGKTERRGEADRSGTNISTDDDFIISINECHPRSGWVSGLPVPHLLPSFLTSVHKTPKTQLLLYTKNI